MPAGKSGSAFVVALYSEHHGWLRNWLHRKLGCPERAAELAHDTFVRVLGRPAYPADVREPRAWLATIAHGLVVDHVRRRDLERACLEAIAALPETHAPSPETAMLLLDTLTRLDRLLDGLNPRARAAFLMSRLEDMTYPEIAARLGVCLSSVEKYMAVALRHCYTASLPG